MLLDSKSIWKDNACPIDLTANDAYIPKLLLKLYSQQVVSCRTSLGKPERSIATKRKVTKYVTAATYFWKGKLQNKTYHTKEVSSI